jgi:light-regulated signal transduction histidine kinase (bacteriophytochrome)
MNRSELAASYTDALRNYIAKASESTLERAHELGRQAIESGLSSTDIVAAHHHALRELDLALGSEPTQGRKERFLIESLGPLEMTRHGYIEANRDLQRLFEEVSERTAELENANYELESFNYYISHDLRTSLQAVLGFSQTLEGHYGGELSAGAHRCVEQISNGARQMAELIDGLLSLAQIGGAPLDRRPVDLDALARKAISELAPQLADRRIEVAYRDVPIVRGDSVLLERLLVNLLANAVKFTGSRKRAKIEIGSCVKNGEQIIFVRDNGVGFDMKRARRLFGLFERLHSAEEFEGTGIGLALAKRIVTRHGGRIWAEAAEGKGATFYFTLEKSQLSAPRPA